MIKLLHHGSDGGVYINWRRMRQERGESKQGSQARATGFLIDVPIGHTLKVGSGDGISRSPHGWAGG